MKARPSKTKGKKLHIPPPEFARAEKVRGGSWWQWQQQEAIRQAEKERSADFKQPHRKAPPRPGSPEW